MARASTPHFALPFRFDATGGAETHTLTINEIPSHSHSISWLHTSGPGPDPTSVGIPPHNGSPANSFSSGTGSAGGGQPHNNMPPYMVMNFIIKT